MRTNWTFICTAVAAGLLSSAASAQFTCDTAVSASVGANAFNTSGSATNLAMPAGAGCGSAHTIYKTSWFKFTPTVTGAHTLSLCGGSTWDTRMAVLNACDPAAGVVACNDDSCGLQSQVIATLNAGTEYKIVIGGYGSSNSGAGTLTVSAPSGGGGGNPCDNAIALTLGANPFQNTPTGLVVDMTGYCTMQFTAQIYNTNYYKFTPKTTGMYTFSTCGTANFDTKIAVQNACATSSGVLACNDDGAGCAGFTSLTTPVELTGGLTYYVLIGGYASSTTVGGGTITVAESGGGGSGSCDKATEIFEGPNDFVTSVGSGDLDLTGVCDPGGFGDDLVHNVVYFRFTPTQDGIWSATTCNTAAWDTRIAVLSGCDPSSVIGCNDDGAGCTAFTSVVEFEGVSGQEVIVAVGGYAAGDSGAGVISMVYGSTVLSCGNPKAGDCCSANGTPACSDEVCCEAVCAADAFCCDTQWDQICADSATFVCAACGAGGCKFGAGAEFEIEQCGEDLNGGCNSATGFDSQPISVGSSVGGTFWADGNIRDTDWYLLDLSEATEVQLTISSNIPCFAAMVDTACSSIIGDITTGNCGGTTFVCVPPGQYFIVALPSTFNGFPCGFKFGNEYLLEVGGIPCDAAAPPNDNCADATPAIVGNNPFDNTFAGTEWPEPSCGFGGTAFTKDVFFTFTPETSANYTLETCSGPAPFDTGIEVWLGCPIEGGTLIGCNDDGTGCAAFASSLVTSLDAGTTYVIRVGGWGGASGATDLVISEGGEETGCGAPSAGDCCAANTAPYCNDATCCNQICAADPFCCNTQWDQICANAAVAGCDACGGGGGGPPNDECADAVELVDDVTPFSTVGATGVEATACTEFGGNIYNNVWYYFDADESGTHTVSLCAANGGSATYDSKIAIFTGSCGSLSYLTCDDDTCGLASEVTFQTECGVRYYICLGAYGAAGSGTGNIALVHSGTPCGNPGDLNGDGVVDAADLSMVLGGWGTPAGDVNGDGTTDAADLAAVLGGWTF